MLSFDEGVVISIKVLKQGGNASVCLLALDGIILTSLAFMLVTLFCFGVFLLLFFSFIDTFILFSISIDLLFLIFITFSYKNKRFSLCYFLFYHHHMNHLGKKIIVLGMTIISSVAIAFGFLQEGASSDQNTLLHDLRIQAIQQLIDKEFTHFVTMPFGPWNDSMHLSGLQTYPNFPSFTVTTWIIIKDDLDILLEKKIQNMDVSRPFYASLARYSQENLALDTTDIKQLKKVYLFKDTQDLKDLWYIVSSYRTRINKDAARRRDNMSISFRNIWNIRVLNTQQQMSFMDEIHYDPAVNNWKRDTVSGLAIMWGVTSVKGWGICGASRAINTVLLPNRAFEIITRYNHTRTYKNMYQNTINGQEFRIPWLDVAVYRMGGGQKDFVFKNIRQYPVVLVMNYDGSIDGEEELFVLSHEEDRWTLAYIGKKGNCYTWQANGVSFRSCYNSVAW